ncbi:fatty acid desaturase family protein [Jatrophihabitans sp.]|uniref:fatty acid desaturase family protein n=1 Tax=Jatrophihabitans sp. TaxID=1932789 RepID=UPI002C5442FB|nr:acyl-CoA desaturase [Jatrophihabitans sp.]
MTATAETTRGSDFALLCRQVRAAGLLGRRGGHYAMRISVTVLALVAVAAGFVLGGDSWYQLGTAAVLGVVSTQLAFLGHDAGHQQIFKTRRANDLLGIGIGGLLVGLSYGWWLDKHNRHHANPNHEEHDPDIGESILAFTTAHVAARTGGLYRLVARYQAWLFFPLLCFEGLQLHVASVQSLISGRQRRYRRTEWLLLSVHLVGYLAAVLLVLSPVRALAFVAVHQAVFGIYMGCAFAPNHKGMTVVAPGERLDFLRRQVLTSRNVRGGWFTDLLLGGLNYQIEHHLFPSMPRPNLRHARRLVHQYCQEHRISYTETSLLGSYRAALGYLHALGAPLREPR